ncbi:MAG: SUMF1/EgtB/PvdO family nonheme iron enzyme [Saprospiraceae bacterium]|nr:SUMF1/EgtB/PvdO family nonheme iron enzyme [Candidatus Vicinibacter affinis]MBP6172163.1 SUMF1/EgtB/PvdO family nonheme iron enzyme [Saprospiraceae bacterium]MBK6571225.1 SUMF1/EgtB/PvdO family nonheme iron enzyme [Candidatus Vicinibacter affinis]MBK7304959.1 SUMF1/EgtB/PvdO family nonheme iron enzyme [Candidatus Vicinibacter affinis]MBK7694724.1 SUMF1/EgtB/PvdO family nonheme iron enzyme [Candidatus Vicinibacter affinis]
MKVNVFSMVSLLGLFLMISACSKRNNDRSSATGWKYNDPEYGGFEKVDYAGQPTGPNLVLIEGGTFTMGLTQEDVTYEWNNIPRRVTVSSFYMDETEVSNINYREYVFWLGRVFKSYPDVARKALPDTLVWREELAYNEPFVETYFRFPSYDEYPVVGVSWLQAKDYCKWRTDRVNEMILIEKGIFNPNPDQVDAENFDTKSYLAGQYQGNVRKNLPDITTGGERSVRFEDGILLPEYRLPTEAEWEYAALALKGKQSVNGDELYTDKRFFPWDGNTARYKRRDKYMGNIMANFKKAGGDYMGMAGKLNDHSHIPGPVRTFWPNDFGLYNMAGNVSEWVEDVFRPLTATTLRDVENHDLNPFRGNEFKELVLDESGVPVEKDSLGMLRYQMVTDSAVTERENYNKGGVKDFRDDDSESVEYAYGKYSLISNKSRVIKGGSWSDRLFWLSPGSRRFKDEDKSDRNIGFRCAMTRTGGPEGNEDAGGLEFKRKMPKQKRSFK